MTTYRLLRDHAASDALDETTADVLRTDSIDAIVLFGSQARGTATATSDIDVIYLLKSARFSGNRLYRRMTLRGIELDINLVSSSDVSRLIAFPSWQYRFKDARFVYIEDAVQTAAKSWLIRIQAWVTSRIARNHRIRFFRDRILQLIARAEEFGPENPAARAFCHALALERSLFVMCELAGVVPFADLNPLETLCVRAQADAIPGDWPLPPGEIGADQAQRLDCWKQLKTLLQCSMLAVPEFVDVASDGGDNADIILAIPRACLKSKSLRGVYSGQAWSEELVRAWIYQALALSGDSDTMRRSGITLRRIVHRVPIAGERRVGPRYNEYDPVRQRVKVIVPTGGCRLPRCTFCRLPEFASEQAKINGEAVFGEAVFGEASEGIREVAIYTDGSFFDDREVTDEARLVLAERLRTHDVLSVVVESLPQLATRGKVARFLDSLGNTTRLTISVGIQTTDHLLRRIVLGTPTTQAGIESFFNLRPELAFAIRVYLLYGKPLLTLDEDESDVRQSVQKLSERLMPGDKVTVNYLNVVRDTHLDLLERSGLYVRSDLCRFRKFVQGLAMEAHGFAITPGCVAVRSCSERDLADGCVCSNCLEWLTMAEQGGRPRSRLCCRREGFVFELPWRVFGDVEDRCQFVSSVLKRDSTAMFDVHACTAHTTV